MLSPAAVTPASFVNYTPGLDVQAPDNLVSVQFSVGNAKPAFHLVYEQSSCPPLRVRIPNDKLVDVRSTEGRLLVLISR